MAKYCFDTSALIEGWVRSYPYDVFPTLWSNLERMIEDGDILCPDEVLIELAKKEDDLHKWAKLKKKLFYPLDNDLQVAVVEVLTYYPGLAAQKSSRNHADPFVVALAKITNRIVVSGEKNRGNPDGLIPKIPDVCQAYDIRCITLLQFIRDQKWNF